MSVLLVVLLAGAAFAQNVNVAPPKAPFVNTPPPGSRWSLTIQREESSLANPAKPSPVQPISLEKRIGTNGVQEGIIVHSDTRRDVYYVSGGQILRQFANSPKISISPLGDMGDTALPLVGAGFPALDWLSEKNYRGVEMLGKEACYFFESDKELLIENSRQKVRAWIRISDGYPVRVALDDSLLEFSPVEKFPGTVELPSEYQAAQRKLDRELEALQALKQKSSR